MAIPLDLTIDSPDGGAPISYAFLHLKDGGYAGVSVSASWEQGSVGTAVYVCLWSDLSNFILAMVGNNTVIPDGSDTRYSRTLPHRYPISALPNLYGTKIIDVKGVPGEVVESDGTTTIYPKINSDGIQYRYAEVTVQYEPVPYPLKTDTEVAATQEWKRFTSIRKAPRLEFLNTKIAQFKWVSDQNPVDTGIFLREQSVDYIVTFHRVPEPFFNPADFIGYANVYDGFLAGHPQVPTAGFLAQTMCLMGVEEIIKAVAFTDILLYDYVFYFKYMPNGFHKTRRITASSFDYAEFSLTGATPAAGTAGNSIRLVPLKDLSALFMTNA